MRTLLKFLLKVIYGIIGSMGGAIFGAFVGTMYAANAAVGFRIGELRGYEAGAPVGAVIGAVLGSLIAVHLLGKLQLTPDRNIRVNRSMKKTDKTLNALVGLLVGVVSAMLLWNWMVNDPQSSNQSITYREEAASYRTTHGQDEWMLLTRILDDAIYYGDVDAILAITYPGSTTREQIDALLPQWRQYRFDMAGSQAGLVDPNNENIGYISFDAMPDKFNLVRIDGKWYLKLAD